MIIKRFKIFSKFILFILLAFSCQKREWNNPFDPDCPKEIFTPISFKAVQEGNSIKLTWEQPVNTISSFKIVKQVDSGQEANLPDQPNDNRQYIDAGAIGGKVHNYKLIAFAGSNQSNPVTANITPLFNVLISTTSPTNFTATTAILSGYISSDGGSPITERGICYSTNSNPTTGSNTKLVIGNGTGVFSQTVTGLTANTTYFASAYAINSQGTTYGNVVNFKTSPILSWATLTTNTATNITSTSATLGGDITSDGNSIVTERGVCYSTSQNPTTSSTKLNIGSGIGNFSNIVTGLTANTTYYVRAYAINSQGTAYGNQVDFAVGGPIDPPPNGGETVTDIDGNIYHTVTIGTQVWMVENLKVTKYNDGTNIPNITDNTTWSSLSSGSYCWYNNDATYKNTYGALYNWYAVNTNKLAPIGWHVPTDTEWTTLTTFLGGRTIAGGKMKAVTGWDSPNTDATNESGFSCLPGGIRTDNFLYLGTRSFFWSSTEDQAVYGWYRLLYWQNGVVSLSNYYKEGGLSVRCIKD